MLDYVTFTLDADPPRRAPTLVAWHGDRTRLSPLVVMEGINEEEEGSRVSGSEPEQ
jgi:hypothetical protein